MHNIRKIVKNGRGSYYINIPKELMKELKWKERQKIVVTRRGKTVTIKDWQPKKKPVPKRNFSG